MCLAVPGKVVNTFDHAGIKMAMVDFGGVKREVCVDHVNDVVAGEYVIVHVGFALSKLDEAQAMRTLQLFDELAAMNAPDSEN